jgi:hypothetical protein
MTERTTMAAAFFAFFLLFLCNWPLGRDRLSLFHLFVIKTSSPGPRSPNVLVFFHFSKATFLRAFYFPQKNGEKKKQPANKVLEK